MLPDAIRIRLDQVAARLRRRDVYAAMAGGLIPASWLAMALAVLYLQTGVLWLLWLAPPAWFLPLAFAVLRVGSRPLDPQRAAKAIDSYYDLKDSLSSACEFGARPAMTGMQEFQVRRAVRQVAEVDPLRVVPRAFPRGWQRSCGWWLASLLSLVLSTWWGAPPRLRIPAEYLWENPQRSLEGVRLQAQGQETDGFRYTSSPVAGHRYLRRQYQRDNPQQPPPERPNP